MPSAASIFVGRYTGFMSLIFYLCNDLGGRSDRDRDDSVCRTIRQIELENSKILGEKENLLHNLKEQISRKAEMSGRKKYYWIAKHAKILTFS